MIAPSIPLAVIFTLVLGPMSAWGGERSSSGDSVDVMATGNMVAGFASLDCSGSFRSFDSWRRVCQTTGMRSYSLERQNFVYCYSCESDQVNPDSHPVVIPERCARGTHFHGCNVILTMCVETINLAGALSTASARKEPEAVAPPQGAASRRGGKFPISFLLHSLLQLRPPTLLTVHSSTMSMLAKHRSSTCSPQSLTLAPNKTPNCCRQPSLAPGSPARG